MQLLQRMFEVEMNFMKSDAHDVQTLADAFHPDVVVHEPASLPYAGDWRGLEGLGALFHRMNEVWSAMSVDDLEALGSGDTVLMTCRLTLTARSNAVRITQPFAEVLRFQDNLLIDGTPFYHDTSAIMNAIGSVRAGTVWGSQRGAS